MMTKRPRIKIKTGPLGSGRDSDGDSIFEIDGHDVSQLVSGFMIKSEVGSVNSVILRLIGPELDLDIEGFEIEQSKSGSDPDA